MGAMGEGTLAKNIIQEVSSVMGEESKQNYLFSSENSYGEKMYAIVVGASSEEEAGNIVPPSFDNCEGTVDGVPKSAYDADVFYANKNEGCSSKSSKKMKKNMEDEYGKEEGDRIFYATKNKQEEGYNDPAPKKNNIEAFKRMLDGVVVVCGEGSIDLSAGGDHDIHIGLMHDSSGYTPAACLCVDEYLSEDEVLQGAWEGLYEHTLEKNPDYVKELQDEHGDDWSDMLTEAWDGITFTCKASEVADAIQNDKFAKRFITVD